MCLNAFDSSSYSQSDSLSSDRFFSSIKILILEYVGNFTALTKTCNEPIKESGSPGSAVAQMADHVARPRSCLTDLTGDVRQAMSNGRRSCCLCSAQLQARRSTDSSGSR